MPLSPVWPVIFSIILNELVSALSAVKSAVVQSTAKADHFHNIAIKFLMNFNNYYYILL